MTFFVMDAGLSFYSKLSGIGAFTTGHEPIRRNRFIPGLRSPR